VIPAKKAGLIITAVLMALGMPLVAPAFGGKSFPVAGVVYAQDDWKKEFEDICSKSQNAMAFSEDQLRNLIERCDKLKPLIEDLDERPRKIYLKRLRMCRGLFLFVLESKENK
jgi:TolA-binding protein